MPTVAQVIQTLAAIQLVYGLVVFDVVATVSGVVFMQAAKCWYLDRMVLLFEAVKPGSWIVRPIVWSAIASQSTRP